MKKVCLLLVTILITFQTWAGGIKLNGVIYKILSAVPPYTVGVQSLVTPIQSNSVVIPSTVPFGGNNYTVTTILPNAFFDVRSVSRIVLPTTVDSISTSAFQGCTALDTLNIPATVTTLPDYVFDSCLLNHLTFDSPSRMQSLGNYVFSHALVSNITLPNSIKKIGFNVFDYCSSLTSIHLPDSLQTTGAYAFGWCVSLTSITIPKMMDKISEGAFNNCSALQTISFTKPSNVQHIYDRAFENCSSLQSIAIPTSVVDIGKTSNYFSGGTFSNCTSLKSVTFDFPSSLSSIGDYGFSYYSNYSSDFYNCKALTIITLPNSLVNLSSGTFEECTALSTISLGNSLQTIGYCCFKNTPIQTITLPKSLINIMGNAFDGCGKLTSVTVLDTFPNVITLGQAVFSGVNVGNDTLFVPYGSEASWTVAPQWSDFFYVIGVSTLPVKSISFYVTTGRLGNNLRWQTGSEINTSNFIIQHSVDGKSFTNIGSVSANGNGANSYEFTDKTPVVGTNYYRLKSIDKDGAISYSKVVTVQFANANNRFTVYPNPVKNVLTISGEHITRVQVLDNMGRVVNAQSLHDAKNPIITVDRLSSGVYHLRIQTTDGVSSSIGFIKE